MHMPDSAPQKKTRKLAEPADDSNVDDQGLEETRLRYNAFISYSHAVDHQFAFDLQNGIQRFGTPWNPLRLLNPVRTLRIFRDESSLAANPALWQSIEQALLQSEWLILLASEEAARSSWIEKEVDFWCHHKPVNRILFVLTSDEIVWDSDRGDFDWDKTTALPRCLSGVFNAEPRWIDMRWAHNASQPHSSDPRFRNAIAELVSPLRNIPKDDLIGEDIRQHRILGRWRNVAIILLSVLFVGAVVATQIARKQRSIALLREKEAIEQKQEAERQSQISLARRLAAQSNYTRVQWTDRIELSLLLALESVKLHPSFEGIQALNAALELTPRQKAIFPHGTMVSPLDHVKRVAFSPDSRLLATASNNGTAAIWDIGRSGSPGALSHAETSRDSKLTSHRSLLQHRLYVGSEVNVVAFNQDGRLLATGDKAGTVIIWSVKTGKKLLSFEHEGSVVDLVFDPKGIYLATGSEDGTARLWDLHSGREVGRVSYGSNDSSHVQDVDFSPDGRFFASIAYGGSACFWDVERASEDRCVFTTGYGLSLSYSPDGKSLATSSGNVAQIWAVDSGEQQVRVEHTDYLGAAKMFHDLWVDNVAFTPDGRYLATASRDRTARIWDVKTGQEVLRLQHNAPVDTVAFSPDGRVLVTASAVGNIQGWEMLTGREVSRVSLSLDVPIFDALAISPDGKYVAAGNAIGEVGIWELSASNEEIRLTHPDDVRKIAFSFDGKFVATADDDNIIRLWSTQTWQEIASIKRFSPKKLVFSADNRFLAVRSLEGGLELLTVDSELRSKRILPGREAHDVILHPRFFFSEVQGMIKVWETSGGNEVAEIETNGYSDSFAISRNGSFVSTLYKKEKKVRIWSVPKARQVGEFDFKFLPYEIALSRNGEYLAVAVVSKPSQHSTYDDGIWHVEIWKIAEHRQVTQIPLDAQNVEDLFFHPNDKRLFIVSGPFQWPDAILGFDIESGKETVQLSDADDLRKLQLSPDGNYLAAISKGRGRVWDLQTGQLVAQALIQQHVQDLSFSADGRYLATAGNDNYATLWLWQPEDLISAACSRLTRNLSSKEWQDYLGDMPYQKTCLHLPGDK
jgi:WD40 repeat protein